MSPLWSSGVGASWVNSMRRFGRLLRRQINVALRPAPRYRVHFAAGALMACELLGRRVVRKQCFAFAPGEHSAALLALREWMGSPSGRGSLEWVLGNTAVRYLLLPWTPDLANASLRQAFAVALFEQQFKQDASAYAMCFASPRYGQALMVACVSKALLVELKAHARSAGVRLASITPGVAAVWNRFEKLLASEQGTVSLVDGDRLVALCHKQGCINSIALRPFDPDPTGDIVMPSTGAQGRQRVFASIWLPQLPEEIRLSLRNGEGFREQEDATYAFALCGVH